MLKTRSCVVCSAFALESAIGGCSSSGSEEATALGATPLTELRLTIPGTPEDYAAPTFQIQ